MTLIALMCLWRPEEYENRSVYNDDSKERNFENTTRKSQLHLEKNYFFLFKY